MNVLPGFGTDADVGDRNSVHRMDFHIAMGTVGRLYLCLPSKQPRLAGLQSNSPSSGEGREHVKSAPELLLLCWFDCSVIHHPLQARCLFGEEASIGA